MPKIDAAAYVGKTNMRAAIKAHIKKEEKKSHCKTAGSEHKCVCVCVCVEYFVFFYHP